MACTLDCLLVDGTCLLLTCLLLTVSRLRFLPPPLFKQPETARSFPCSGTAKTTLTPMSAGEWN